MGVTVVTGHRLEDLFEALLQQLLSDPLGPMATETVLVPGQGIARWLELRIADRLGIAAGIEMPFLNGYLQRLSTGGNGSADMHSDLFSREVLVLRIWRLISERLHMSDAKLNFGAATEYCKRDDDGRKRLQLCTRLANCFDDYQIYRDDLLTDFAKGDDHKALSPHAPWQARLWRALLEDAGLLLPRARSKQAQAIARTPFLFAEMAEDQPQPRTSSDAGHRLTALRRNLDDPDWCQSHLPSRLSVFGCNTMPKALLDALYRIARTIPVQLYVPQPTPHYIGDLRARKNRSGDNALLARFGAESREFQSMLLDLEDEASADTTFEQHDLDELETGDAPCSLLQCVQQDIVGALDRSSGDHERYRMTAQDDSLRVHDCHSPQRELEVVRDQIFAAFEADASLQARDILVLVTDIDRYAPYAQAVFGPLQYQLPFHIADRHPARELPICRSLLSVLELASTRLTLADVLHLLENPSVQRRFELFPADVPVLRHLCQTAGIRWGLDGKSRHEQFDLPAFDDNSWRSGLDRLLLGTLTGPSDRLILLQLPVADTTEARGEVLAKFVSFATVLFAQIAQLRRSHTFAAWADRVDQLAEALFAAADGDEEDALRQLQRATTQMRNNARTANHNTPVTPAVLRDWLNDALAQGAPARGFLGGSITIAAMLPMRAVPVRCLFVCGLDDASFPRRDQPAPFDLLAAKPRPGDRNRRLDDRQLFLDLLLAARDRLHFSYVGHSAKDNAEGAPSVVLAELFDYVDRTCCTGDARTPHEHLVVSHPLQAWSERYHNNSDSRLFTYAREVLPSGGSRRFSPERQPWCPEDFTIQKARVDDQDDSNGGKLLLDDLLEFWWHPCRTFLRRAMRVRLRKEDEGDAADEPFALDALTRYQLQDDAVRSAQRGEPMTDDAFALARAKSVLPVGSHGEASFHAMHSATEPLLEEARRYAATSTRRIDLRLGADMITGRITGRITGSIDGFGEHDLTYLRVSKLKSKDRMRAWILHLVVTLQRAQDGEQHHPAWPRQTRVLAGNGVWRYGELPAAEAKSQLLRLIELYHLGLRRPLPFFERSSYALAEQLSKKGDPESALRSACKHFEVKDTTEPWNYDAGDLDVAMCMRDRDPFEGGMDSEFFQLARDLWQLPLRQLQEQP